MNYIHPPSLTLPTLGTLHSPLASGLQPNDLSANDYECSNADVDISGWCNAVLMRSRDCKLWIEFVVFYDRHCVCVRNYR